MTLKSSFKNRASMAQLVVREKTPECPASQRTVTFTFGVDTQLQFRLWTCEPLPALEQSNPKQSSKQRYHESNIQFPFGCVTLHRREEALWQ
jgi:hypothetical protein